MANVSNRSSLMTISRRSDVNTSFRRRVASVAAMPMCISISDGSTVFAVAIVPHIQHRAASVSTYDIAISCSTPASVAKNP